jgi:predicted nucleic acid-binding protein
MRMLFLIDPNVLISSYDETEEQHERSHELMQKAMNEEVEAVLAHQNLLEYLAVATDPKRVEYPLPLEDALASIDIYISSLHIISPKATTFALLQRLLRAKPVTKGRIFDLYLAATVLDNGITQICTWNPADFEGVPQLEVATPAQILK